MWVETELGSPSHLANSYDMDTRIEQEVLAGRITHASWRADIQIEILSSLDQMNE